MSRCKRWWIAGESRRMPDLLSLKAMMSPIKISGIAGKTTTAIELMSK